MISPFDPTNGNLPPGIHEATWDELVARYGYTPHRLRLLAGLKAALDGFRQAGCERAYLDGSFVTAREVPNDFDVCWEMGNVDFDLLDRNEPVLLDWSNHRSGQRARFQGELFIAELAADPRGTAYLEFFQQDRNTGEPKGIIGIDMGDLP